MNSEKEKKSKENETLTLVPRIGLIPKEEGKKGKKGKESVSRKNPSISISNQTKRKHRSGSTEP